MNLFSLKHILHVIAFCSFVTFIVFISTYSPGSSHEACDYGYGILITAFLQLLVVLSIPQILCNALGLIIYDTFPGDTQIKWPPKAQADHSACNGDGPPDASKISTNLGDYSPAKALNLPHLCFRVVTRGLYPALVQRNVNKNYATCLESGLENFSIEVVTDKELHLSNSNHRIRQLVVPANYRSSTGALFKARALQYALEPKSSPVQDGDYIVHLDEETLVSQNSVRGIVNFALDGRHAFGQGLITYASHEVVNWVTTLADTFRVADDLGKLRFQLRALHKAVFGWKGSFVVTKYEAELDVSFDHGPDGSIAEDCYFSMVALLKGYTFDFIEGEMSEKSPFTILDLLRQRKRWVQGIWLVVHSPKIPLSTKFLLAISHYSMLMLPIMSLSYILTRIFPLPSSVWVTAIGTFCFAVIFYMYLFGVYKSLDLRKGTNPAMLVVYLTAQVFTMVLNILIENVAVVWGLTESKHNFHIVEKDIGREVVLEA